MDGATLRLATPHDRSAIETLMRSSIRDIFPSVYGYRETSSAIEYVGVPDQALIADGTYFVIEERGELIACGGWSRRDRLYTGSESGESDTRLLDPATEPARIRAMFTRSDRTRRGHGTTILQACEDAARAEGFQTMSLMATLAGLQLYRRFGFELVERVSVTLPDGVALACGAMVRPIREPLPIPGAEPAPSANVEPADKPAPVPTPKPKPVKRSQPAVKPPPRTRKPTTPKSNAGPAKPPHGPRSSGPAAEPAPAPKPKPVKRPQTAVKPPTRTRKPTTQKSQAGPAKAPQRSRSSGPAGESATASAPAPDPQPLKQPPPADRPPTRTRKPKTPQSRAGPAPQPRRPRSSAPRARP